MNNFLKPSHKKIIGSFILAFPVLTLLWITGIAMAFSSKNFSSLNPFALAEKSFSFLVSMVNTPFYFLDQFIIYIIVALFCYIVISILTIPFIISRKRKGIEIPASPIKAWHIASYVLGVLFLVFVFWMFIFKNPGSTFQTKSQLKIEQQEKFKRDICPRSACSAITDFYNGQVFPLTLNGIATILLDPSKYDVESLKVDPADTFIAYDFHPHYENREGYWLKSFSVEKKQSATLTARGINGNKDLHVDLQVNY